ncbi:MAG: protein-L-isoaspartate O-methyltransferase [Zoogloeaceae bacterium]|nr:protein-L-isoaspartate O-methyltransferase [Zoogloeaceae bacterium]
MNFERARFNMVEQQVRPWDVLDPAVLETMMRVRREEFVRQSYRSIALSEAVIPLPCGQVMLPPVIEGKVLQAVQVGKEDQVLEIGSGSGYFAALLAAQAAWVRTIEIEPELVRLASSNLNSAEVHNVIVEEGDGAQGWAKNAPYDVIVVSGGLPMLPAAFTDQLKVGGRLFAFVGEAPVMVARLVTKVAEGQLRTEDLFETLVPTMKNAVKHESFTF